MVAFLGLSLAGCDEEDEAEQDPAPAPRPAPPTAGKAAEGTDQAEGMASAPVLPPAEQVPTTRDLRLSKTPHRHPEQPAVLATRRILRRVLEAHALDPEDAWGLGHGLLALGPGATLEDGTPVVDRIFAAFARRRPGGGIDFPARAGGRPVAPHQDLVLKVLTEMGVSLARPVEVEGRPATPADLYRTALARSWVAGSAPGAGSAYRSPDDLAWSLQGLSAWAPRGDDLRWTARGGHPMSLSRLSTAALDVLRRESRVLRQARARGETPSRAVLGRAGQLGILGFTCGGAHLIQGVAHAAGRGFVPEERRGELAEEASLYLWRLGWEVPELDAFRDRFPNLGPQLLVQRMKFLGHLLETVHKLAILGLFSPDADAQEAMGKAVEELTKTVALLESSGWFEGLETLREDPKPRFPGVTTNRQIYLDTVGDAAHALRGLELATGRARYLH